MIIESKTLTDLWAKLETGKGSRFQKNTQWHTTSQKTVTSDDESISKVKTKRQIQKQEPIIQTAEAVKNIVVDETAKTD